MTRKQSLLNRAEAAAHPDSRRVLFGRTRNAGRITLVALGLSVPAFEVTSLVTEVAVHADHPCGTGEMDVTRVVEVPDDNPNDAIITTVLYCGDDAPAAPTVSTSPYSVPASQPPNSGSVAPTVPHETRPDDNDGIPNGEDNCDYVDNPDQANYDGDQDGDVCDPDDDNDDFPDTFDTDPFSPGHGDVAVADATAKGYDLSDQATYLAILSTSPDSWAGRNLVMVPAATTATEASSSTTTTTASTTTETEIETTIAQPSMTDVPVIGVHQTSAESTTTIVAVSPTDRGGKGGKNNWWYLTGIPGVSLMAGAIVLARRKQDEHGSVGGPLKPSPPARA